MYAIFFSMLLDIGLLVLIATLLTKFSPVRQLFIAERHLFRSGTALAVIFAAVSVLSTYTGVRTNGAIINTRAIGVLAAGLLGGPYVGIGAAAIAAAHRYLLDIGGFTAIPCMLSTIVEGLIGVCLSKHYQSGKIKLLGVFLMTALAETVQMLIILVLARPFDAAVALVKIIAMPMIIMNALGMVIFLMTLNRVFIEEDSEFAGKIRLAFEIAERSLPFLRKGLYSQDDIRETVKIIYESFPCVAVMISHENRIQAFSPEGEWSRFTEAVPLKSAISSDFSNNGTVIADYGPRHTVIAAPLLVENQETASLIMVVERKLYLPQATVSFVEKLAGLFSTQLELSGLDYQKTLRRKAELNALQSQVNPHFLYNALNTIACVCREDPLRARELIHTLSGYYRQTLEAGQYKEDGLTVRLGERRVDLQTEIRQVLSYLELEKARYEERLKTEFQIDADADCMVPPFILQPLVENAVRHGVDRNGNRFVRVRVKKERGGIRISIHDHGRGFPADVIEHLNAPENKKGIGLKNVHQRLKAIFKTQAGLHLENTPEGAVVTFFIPTCEIKEEVV